MPDDSESLGVRGSTLLGAGEGLFALRDFCAGENVCDYVGEQLSHGELSDLRYVLKLSAGKYLDAGNTPSFVRFINTLYPHQIAKYNGFNCCFVHNRMTGRVRVVTTRDVPKTSEFFIDYNFD